VTRLRAHRLGLLELALAAFVIAMVIAPMVLTSRGFNAEWTNHLWLVRQQVEAIKGGGLPSYYLHSDGMGVFYPHFLFYGGTVYSLAAYLSFVLGGSIVAAFVALVAVGFAAAYAGMYWLGAQAGLPRWWRHLPPITYVTSAIVVSSIYARGGWPEFIAQSSIPLVLAAIVHTVRVRRLGAGHAVLVFAGVLLFTGTHNLSLAWGTVLLAGVVVVLALAGRGTGVVVRRPGLGLLVAVGGLAVGVSAWFLVPDVLYADRIGFKPQERFEYEFYGQLKFLFAPFRLNPSLADVSDPVERSLLLPNIYVQVPSLALLWALGCLPLLRRLPAARAWARLAAGLLVLLVAFVVLVMVGDPALGSLSRSIWPRLPGFLRYVQNPFRLDPYVAALVSGLVIVALVGVRGTVADARRRALVVGPLVAITLFGSGSAVWQAWSAPSFYPDRGVVLAGDPHHQPTSWSDRGNYRDYTEPGVPSPGEPPVVLDPTAAASGRPVAVALPQAGRAYRTNIAAGSYLVAVRGLEPIGRSREYLDPAGFEQKGLMVVRSHAGEPAATVLISTRRTFPVVAGLAITTVSLLLVLAAVGLAATGRRVPGLDVRRRGSRRRRRSRRPRAPSARR
jgi:hypothetical protein